MPPQLAEVSCLMSLKGRRLIFVAIYWCTAPASLPGQTRETDSLAILDVIDQHEAAMRTFQAEQQIKIYAADAVWINAFGTRRAGRDSILAFLVTLNADSGYRASQVRRVAPPEVIFLRPDVAIVRELHQRDGQRLPDGSLVDRRIHTSYVLSKDSGRWLIKYEHIADVRPRSRAMRSNAGGLEKGA
jgi:uncharacterized protein (TIGR02246 family)